MSETGNFNLRGAFVDALFERVQQYNGTAIMSESSFEVSQTVARLHTTFNAKGTFNYTPEGGALHHINFGISLQESLEADDMYVTVRVQAFDPSNTDLLIRSGDWTYEVSTADFNRVAAENAFVYIHGIALNKF